MLSRQGRRADLGWQLVQAQRQPVLAGCLQTAHGERVRLEPGLVGLEDGVVLLEESGALSHYGEMYGRM